MKSGGGEVGANSVELDASPYEAAGTFYLDQSCDLINRGSFWAPTPLDGPDAYSTCSYAKRDVGRADIGFHYTSYENTDADNLPDAWEVQYFGNLSQADGSTASDDDSLTAVQEFWHGTNPNSADTDGDGYNDPDEVGVQQKKLLRGWGPAVYDFMAGPWLSNVASSQVTIGWWAPDAASSPYVYFKKETDTGFTLWGGTIYTCDPGIPGRVYETRLTGLSTGTVYQDYVGYSAGGAVRKSPVCKFRTLEDSPSSFTFVVYGDNRGDNQSGKYNYDHFNENAADVVTAILSKAPTAQFVLHVGDFVRLGGDPDNYHWREHFFLPTTRLIAEYPLFPMAGNHEYLQDANLAHYHAFFDYPDEPSGRTWYHFHYANYNFVVMDSDADFDDQSDQYGDLSDWLEESADYTLFFGHRPPYNDSSGHPYSEGGPLRTYIVPLLNDNYAEAHFAGHSHLYERWEKGSGDPDIDYFVIGGGGAPLHHSENAEPEQYQDRKVATLEGEEYYNFSVVSVTPGGCTVTLSNIEDLEEPVEEHQVSPYQP